MDLQLPQQAWSPHERTACYSKRPGLGHVCAVHAHDQVVLYAAALPESGGSCTLVHRGKPDRHLGMAGTAATLSVLGLIVFGTLASLLGKIGEQHAVLYARPFTYYRSAQNTIVTHV